MMDVSDLVSWVGPVLDVAAVALLAAVLWRLGRDPGAAWAEREVRLQTIFEELRALVAQSEGLARDLDGKLAGREERLKALLAEAESAIGPRAAGVQPTTAVPTAPPMRPAQSSTTQSSTAPRRVEVREDEPTSTVSDCTAARTIERMIDEGADANEIARRLGVPVAEVRLVAGLKAARAARRRVAQEASAHA